MKLRNFAPCWLFLGLFAVLTPVTSAIAADFKGEAKVLAELDNAWSASAANRDLDRLLSFYADDAVIYPAGEGVTHGAAAIRKSWGAIKDPNYSLSWRTIEAQVAASGDIGFTAGTFADSTKGADGKVTNSTGKYLCVWKKQRDGSWKAVHDMWNFDAK